jgi:DNA-binding transcriptional LysR family regulator
VPDLRQLQAFVAVADELHFGRAALRLRCSPSNVSQQVRELERELRLKLFSRTSRRVDLTEVGERLAVQARAVLASAEAFEHQAADMRLEPNRRLTVAYGPFTGHVVTELVREFRQVHHYANVDIRVVGGSEEVSRLVGSGRFDAGIAQWAGDGLERVALRPPIDYAFLVPENHRLYDRECISFADLDGEPIICPPPEQDEDYFEISMAFWAKLGVRPDFQFQFIASIEQTYEFVACGQGLSYTLPIRMPPPGTRFIPVTGYRLPHELFVLWAEGSRSPLLRDFVTTAATLFGVVSGELELCCSADVPGEVRSLEPA